MVPPEDMVETLMNQLFDWMRKSSSNLHPLILSSIFHYEFVTIYPFTDGNSRMARLWQNVILSRWKAIFKYIPIESSIKNIKRIIIMQLRNVMKEVIPIYL